jgi:hypothetical protein
MKKYIVIIFLFMLSLDDTFACEACKKQQAKLLQGISHGPGPDSKWDYLIVAIMILITLYVLYATVKCFIKPSERNQLHIKRTILNDLMP